MIALGTAAAFMAAVATAAAAVLQGEEARRTRVRRTIGFSLLRELIRRPRWALGTLLMVIAWPLQVLALTQAPITVVQPTLATFPVPLLLFARFGLHERVSRQDLAGVLAIMAGMILVLLEAPHKSSRNPPASHLLVPMTVVGASALAAYAFSRLSGIRRRSWVALSIGAGLAYAWVDFANKLLSSGISSGNWLLSVVWFVLVLSMGVIAFVQENAALQLRQAIHVSPLVATFQNPLPVLIALWAGVETWGSSTGRMAMLAAGLALVVAGATALARSGTAELATRPTAGTGAAITGTGPATTTASAGTGPATTTASAGTGPAAATAGTDAQ